MRDFSEIQLGGLSLELMVQTGRGPLATLLSGMRLPDAAIFLGGLVSLRSEPGFFSSDSIKFVIFAAKPGFESGVELPFALFYEEDGTARLVSEFYFLELLLVAAKLIY